MNLAGVSPRMWRTLLLGALTVLGTSHAGAESCALSPNHVGLSFPVQKIEARWTCPLQAIVGDYTTANKIGPVPATLSEPVFFHLLDHPPLTAALIGRLDLGPYKSEGRGAGRFWASDSEGTQGIVELVYQDRAHRIYYVEGTYKSAVFLRVAGKAVLFVQMNPIKDSQGHNGMHMTLVAYTKLDSRLLAGLVSLIRPFAGSAVVRKLTKGFDVVNRLGEEIRQRPDRVLAKATNPPPLPDDEVAMLKTLLGSSGRSTTAAPAGKPSP